MYKAQKRINNNYNERKKDIKNKYKFEESQLKYSEINNKKNKII